METRYHQSINDTYSNIYKFLYNYTNGVDYDEYDAIYKLPTRKNIGTASYVIEKVISDIIDDDLNELITLKLRSNVKDSTINNKLIVYSNILFLHLCKRFHMLSESREMFIAP